VVPKKIELNKNYSFTFIIHNVENKDSIYFYEVYLESEPIKKGNITLKHDEKATIYCDFVVKEQPQKNPFLISVRLGKEQEIHFWVYL